MNMMPGAEILFEQPDVPGGSLRQKQWFAAGDTSPGCLNAVALGDDVLVAAHQELVGVDDVPSPLFFRERAVKTAGGAATGHQ